ncbi:uncharacterized protein A1O5_13444 [Cladophialophora psammophila CBS 110553]|uniref:BZIP domain-containing protein n=1 Tax=Cladophialophora psammophila CBS 110553 TaxID=1182543 RepID=W9VCI7_9EURO|nr:uncharacterized protein A1O5_13444 [Cladophialophora psammophila CBS 110553]EXJ53322.1 hypothetical protein A1O5_13444 [Cladophialophora psammophila CBS 110553]
MTDWPPTRPWASGRILTPAQRERKRAANRVSHRTKRSQAEARTASLESQIELLKAEIELLRRRETAPGCPCSRQNNADANFLAFDPIPPSYLPTLDPWPSLNIAGDDSGGLQSQNAHDSYGATGSSEPPQSLATSCQEIFNHIVSQARRLSKFQVSTDDALNQDVLVRALVNGWSDVSMRYGGTSVFCPLWNLVRYLDRRVFCMSGFLTRLCALRMIHAMLLCFVGASSFKDLPAWYKPRPSQHTIRHALAVDVLPWPGVRERAVYSQGLTQDNKFWTGMVHHFRFHWPYSPSDAVDFDANAGHFALSGLFLNQVHNIHMWKMDLSFFNFFPDLYDDIMPSLYDIERPISCILPAAATNPIFGFTPQIPVGSANIDVDHIPALPLPESSGEVGSELEERHSPLVACAPLSLPQ